jgi:SAM-dependent methyltransferase
MESSDEALRLEAKTDEDESARLLRLVGITRGMSALDVGAGTGAVARTMATLVGSEGRVVALDRSLERRTHGQKLAAEAGHRNLEFITSDIEVETPSRGPYDFVWSRFLFEYLKEPDRALRHMIAATRIGGKVVVGDLDGNAVLHHPLPPMVAAGLDRLLPALEGGFDPYAGRKLYHRFRCAGLAEIRVHLEPYHLYAGAAPQTHLCNWRQKLRTLRPEGAAALGGEREYDRWASAFLDLLMDPDAFSYSVLVLVEGVRTV